MTMIDDLYSWEHLFIVCEQGQAGRAQICQIKNIKNIKNIEKKLSLSHKGVAGGYLAVVKAAISW